MGIFDKTTVTLVQKALRTHIPLLRTDIVEKAPRVFALRVWSGDDDGEGNDYWVIGRQWVSESITSFLRSNPYPMSVAANSGQQVVSVLIACDVALATVESTFLIVEPTEAQERAKALWIESYKFIGGIATRNIPFTDQADVYAKVAVRQIQERLEQLKAGL